MPWRFYGAHLAALGSRTECALFVSLLGKSGYRTPGLLP
jgi:hypothetical protein